tara:strand:+ start:4016 stop:4942 length:927 start_codon:yes stop_codon:yes gene_type:complete
MTINHRIIKSNNKVCCVTTFNQKQLDEYAQWFLKTYNLPFDLIIYSEDKLDLSNYNSNFKFEHIYDDKDFENFQNTSTIDSNRINVLEKCNKSCPEYCLHHFNPNNNHHVCIKKYCDKPKISSSGYCTKCLGGNDEVVKMTKRFSFKIFALKNAYIKYKNNYNYIFWLDSDIKYKQTKERMNFYILDSLYNIKKRNMMFGYFKRLNTYLEAGVMLFNTKHNLTGYFLDDMCNLYLSGRIYNLPQTHDAFVWDYMRDVYEILFDVNNIDFSNNICTKKNIIGNCNVINYTSFANYLNHFKGPRKTNMKH